tara:strand:+ start:1828 stop:2025 length:198 start_codon:yes stop_codon:yes gene_type:complete
LAKIFLIFERHKKLKSKLQHLLSLKDEIAYLKTQTEGGGKGHFFTTINVLEKRIEDIAKEIDKDA